MREGSRSRALAVAAACILIGCGDDTITPPDDFLPIISNQWKNTANENHTFSLISENDGDPSGTFTGTEDHPTLGSSDIEGAFQNSLVSAFTIKRSTGSLTYTGRFVHPDTLRLTRGQETLVITRNIF